MGGIGGRGKFNGVSQCNISYGASKDLVLVHTVQLKTIIKVHSSGGMVSSGISDIVTVNPIMLAVSLFWLD